MVNVWKSLPITADFSSTATFKRSVIFIWRFNVDKFATPTDNTSSRSLYACIVSYAPAPVGKRATSAAFARPSVSRVGPT